MFVAAVKDKETRNSGKSFVNDSGTNEDLARVITGRKRVPVRREAESAVGSRLAESRGVDKNGTSPNVEKKLNR